MNLVTLIDVHFTLIVWIENNIVLCLGGRAGPQVMLQVNVK